MYSTWSLLIFFWLPWIFFHQICDFLAITSSNIFLVFFCLLSSWGFHYVYVFMLYGAPCSEIVNLLSSFLWRRVVLRLYNYSSFKFTNSFSLPVKICCSDLLETSFQVLYFTTLKLFDSRIFCLIIDIIYLVRHFCHPFL